MGSIEGDGIWYGLTRNAWMPSARPIAIATITISSRTAPSVLVGLGISARLNPRGPRPRRPPACSRGGLSSCRSRGFSLSGRFFGFPSSGHLGLGVDLGLGLLDRPGRVLGDRLGLLGEDQVVLDAPAALGDPGALPDAAAQVVELRPADVAASYDLEPLDLRRVHGEHALDADAERLLADGERLTRARALAGDHDPLEDLGPLTRALDDLEVHAHAIPGRKPRDWSATVAARCSR